MIGSQPVDLMPPRHHPQPARMAADGGALGRGGAKFHPDATQGWKTAKKRLRRAAAKLLPGEAVARCGACLSRTMTAGNMSYAGITKSDAGAAWSGVVTCQSVWHCADCATKIARERQKAVALMTQRQMDAGATVAMVTLTVSHGLGDDPGELRRQVAAIWRKVVAGKAWKNQCRAYAVTGGLRALEVTHGRNGWHPHLHVLIYFQLSHITDFCDWLIARWCRTAERDGLRADLKVQVAKVADRPKTAGDYVTKGGIDWELTHAHTKKAKGGGRAPFQILADYTEHQRPRDAALFRAYAKAFKGARQLTSFGDIGAALKAAAAQVDRAEAEAVETVCFVDEQTFAAVQEQNLEGILFQAAERNGLVGVVEILSAAHIGPGGVKPPEFARRLSPAFNRGRSK